MFQRHHLGRVGFLIMLINSHIDEYIREMLWC